MRALAGIILQAVLLAGAFPNAARSESDVRLYECFASTGVAGREEASMSAPLMRWGDGRLRTLEKGHAGYAAGPAGRSLPEWIELFGAQSMRGNSQLGNFRLKHFDCKPL